MVDFIQPRRRSETTTETSVILLPVPVFLTVEVSIITDVDHCAYYLLIYLGCGFFLVEREYRTDVNLSPWLRQSPIGSRHDCIRHHLDALQVRKSVLSNSWFVILFILIQTIDYRHSLVTVHARRTFEQNILVGPTIALGSAMLLAAIYEGVLGNTYNFTTMAIFAAFWYVLFYLNLFIRSTDLGGPSQVVIRITTLAFE